MSQIQILVSTALHSWNQWFTRANKAFATLSDEQLLAEIAPGKNRIVYIYGHLLVVHDAMLPLLRLGESSYQHLRPIFLDQPDRAADLPPIADLRAAWRHTHDELARLFAELPPEAWLERHASVSEEDFPKEPHRNRFNILINRTAHLTYHLGQVIPVIKH